MKEDKNTLLAAANELKLLASIIDEHLHHFYTPLSLKAKIDTVKTLVDKLSKMAEKL